MAKVEQPARRREMVPTEETGRRAQGRQARAMAVAQHLVRETEVLVALRPVREKAGLRRLAVTAAGIAAEIVGLQEATVDRRAVRRSEEVV